MPLAITENFPLVPLWKASHKGTLHMQWDNGRSLGIVIGEDHFKVLSKPQEEQSMDSQWIGGISQ